MKKNTAILLILAAFFVGAWGGWVVGWKGGTADAAQKWVGIESDLLVQLSTERAWHGQTRQMKEAWQDQCIYNLRVVQFWKDELQKRISAEEFKVLWEKEADIE